jgi:hypothetical protein
MMNASGTVYDYVKYWCPAPNWLSNGTSGNAVLQWMGNDSVASSYGLCPDYLIPTPNGCPDNYEPVNINTQITIETRT